MTIHAAVPFYDPVSKTIGYIMGCDSRSQEYDMSDEREFGCVEKFVDGKNTLAFLSGSFKVKGSSANNGLDKARTELSGRFDDITEHTDYSSVDLFNNGSQYRVLVAKQTEDTITLFSISNYKREHPHTAIKLDKSDIQQPNLKKMPSTIYAYSSPNYLFLGIDKILEQDDSIDLTKELLTLHMPTTSESQEDSRLYEPTASQIFCINSKGIERLF